MSGLWIDGAFVLQSTIEERLQKQATESERQAREIEQYETVIIPSWKREEEGWRKDEADAIEYRRVLAGKIERLEWLLRSLNIFADHQRDCTSRELGSGADCSCGYFAVMDRIHACIAGTASQPLPGGVPLADYIAECEKDPGRKAALDAERAKRAADQPSADALDAARYRHLRSQRWDAYDFEGDEAAFDAKVDEWRAATPPAPRGDQCEHGHYPAYCPVCGVEATANKSDAGQ